MLVPKILPYIFCGLPKNVCREIAGKVGGKAKGKWDGTALRYKRAESAKEGVLGRAGANGAAGRGKYRKINLSQIEVLFETSSLSKSPAAKPAAPGNIALDGNIGEKPRCASGTTPLGRLISTLDFNLVPRPALLNKTVAAMALPEPEDGDENALQQMTASSSLPRNRQQECMKFLEVMTAARRKLSERYAEKFSRLMEKSGAELRAAEVSCNTVYQKIYLKEFGSCLQRETGAGQDLQQRLRAAHGHAAAIAVEHMGASGSIADRNYTRFLSTFKLDFVLKKAEAPPIPPRTGKVAYRGNALPYPPNDGQ